MLLRLLMHSYSANHTLQYIKISRSISITMTSLSNQTSQLHKIYISAQVCAQAQVYSLFLCKPDGTADRHDRRKVRRGTNGSMCFPRHKGEKPSNGLIMVTLLKECHYHFLTAIGIEPTTRCTASGHPTTGACRMNFQKQNLETLLKAQLNITNF